MGMINENSANSDSNERVLLYDLWKVLRGEQKEEIKLEDAKIVIMTILRITLHKRIGVAQDGGIEDDQREVGFYNE